MAQQCLRLECKKNTCGGVKVLKNTSVKTNMVSKGGSSCPRTLESRGLAVLIADSGPSVVDYISQAEAVALAMLAFFFRAVEIDLNICKCH